MPDNTAGPIRDGREDVTKEPGANGTGRLTGGPRTSDSGSTPRPGSATQDGALSGRDTAAQERAREGRDTAVDGERVPAAPGSGSGSGSRDGALGGRDTAAQERAREGRDTAAQERAREGRDTAAQERAREGRDTVVDGKPVPAGHDPAAAGRDGLTGKGTGSRSGASREGILGAEARVNAGTGAGTNGRLMPHDEGDKWSLRLQHAVTGFVDGPRGSVEEADKVLQEVAERFTDAVTQRRRTLRSSWHDGDKADTEQLRLALKDYRELAERLLKI